MGEAYFLPHPPLMLRTTALIFCNDLRLLLKDRAAVFMLFVAPIVIIAVAGFSLGNIYGVQRATRVYVIPIVDQDHGAIAKTLIKALSQERSIGIEQVGDLAQARAIVTTRERAPLAIVIPARTTTDFESGRTPLISVYVDPIKRLEASMIELRLNVLSGKSPPRRTTGRKRRWRKIPLTCSLARSPGRRAENDPGGNSPLTATTSSAPSTRCRWR